MGDKDAIFYDYHEEFAESKFDRALFDQLVHTCVTYVPRGKVTTYGHIARLCHCPKHARHVGQALRRLPLNTSVPWQRVINASYTISPRGDGGTGAEEQAMRLGEEGVTVSQDAMGVWRVPRSYAWETGSAQSLAELIKGRQAEEEDDGMTAKEVKEGESHKMKEKSRKRCKREEGTKEQQSIQRDMIRTSAP